MTICFDETAPSPQGIASFQPIQRTFSDGILIYVPDGYQWQVLGGLFTWVVRAGAVDRLLTYEVEDDSSGPVWEGVANATQPPNSDQDYLLARPDVFTPPPGPTNTALFLPLPDSALMGPAWLFSIRDPNFVEGEDIAEGGLWVIATPTGGGPPPPLGVWCEPFVPNNAADADGLYTAHLDRMNALSVTF